MFVLAYFKNLYWDNNDKASYGNRLDGIENYELTDEEVKKVKENIKADEDVIEVEYRQEGRIINLNIKVKDELTDDNARKMCDNFVANFTEKQLSFFSLQFYVYKEDATKTDFPIIGYKHYGNKKVSWTKDR
jgi:hypothetical protein